MDLPKYLKPHLLIFTFACVASSLWSYIRAEEQGISRDYLKSLVGELSFDESITTPEDFLQFRIGSRHVNYHQWHAYAKKICEESDRLTWVESTQTFGGRPLGHAICSSTTRQSNFDALQQQRLSWIFNKASEEPLPISSIPVVVQLVASVHGDEASGMNALMLVLYLLAAGKGPTIDAILENEIVIINGCLNPDGADRFANWVNDQRGSTPSSFEYDREHLLPWPGARTNHYNFDLNRDWLPATQPETQSHLELFYQWLPNLVLDFHEMGTEQSLFFQPGIAGRDNPLVLPYVRETTQNFASIFGQALDARNQRYFTRERFDDYYPGKGSTFPDLHGSVGILVEQGSTRGLIHDYGSHHRTFAETIKNPLLIAVQSLKAAIDSRRSLLEFQRSTLSTHRKLSPESTQQKAYFFALPSDLRIQNEWISFLNRHRIRTFAITHDSMEKWSIPSSVVNWQKLNWAAIPVDQEFGIFLQSFMSRSTKFPFEEFYDVSAWNMADAFGLPWFEATYKSDSTEFQSSDQLAIRIPPALSLYSDTAAILIPGNQINSLSLLNKLSNSKVLVRIATQKGVGTDRHNQEQTIAPGTLCILRSDHSTDWAEKVSLIESVLNDYQLQAFQLHSTALSSGPDLGSNQYPQVQVPRIAILCGRHSLATSAGSLWFSLDRLLDTPVTRLNAEDLSKEVLKPFQCVIIPDCEPDFLSKDSIETLKDWTEQGGHLILTSGATYFHPYLNNNDEESIKSPSKLIHQTSGYIVELEIPQGHLLSLADDRSVLPVFQASTWWQLEGPFEFELKSSERGLLSGFLPEHEQKTVPSKTLLGQSKLKKGKLTAICFDPTFRGHYWGTLSLLSKVVLATNGGH